MAALNTLLRILWLLPGKNNIMYQTIYNELLKLNSITDDSGVNSNLRSTKRNIILDFIYNGINTNIIKITRSNSTGGLDIEKFLLQHISKSNILPDSIDIPSIQGEGKLNKGKYLIMSYVKGEHIKGRFIENQKFIDIVLKFLVSLVSSDIKYFSFSDLSKYIKKISLQNECSKSIDLIITQIKKFDGVPYPVSILHGDLSYNNILFNEDRVGVIDWEDGEIDSYPVIDIIDFLLYDIYRKKRIMWIHLKYFRVPQV